MKKVFGVALSAAALTAASLGVTGVAGVAGEAPASASAPATVHVLLNDQLLHAQQKQLGIATGCLLSTLSLACLPIPLQSHGGPVEASGSKNFLIFWEPTGSTVAANYNATLQQFFGDVGGSSLYGVATQYGAANAASVGGTFTDTSAYPSTTLQDADVQKEVLKAIAANNWPTGVGNEYFVYLAKGENECMGSTCSFSTFCAYHGDFTSGTSTVLYAAMPYAGTDLAGCGIQNSSARPNGADADAEISIASHELMETVTDPQLNAWFDLFGFEIGDKCAYTYGTTAGNGSDITINGHPYIVQEEFSNSALGCAV